MPHEEGANWQPLNEHLTNVAALARQLAQAAAPGFEHFHDLAERCGLLHDYGKYTDCFQDMILGRGGKCPHAIHGAAMAWSQLGATHVAAAVAGHHAGMADIGGNELRDKVKKSLTDATALLERAAADIPSLGQLLKGPAPKLDNPGDRFDLVTRMLLSCLVDADRLDTAGRVNVQDSLDAAERLETLLTHLAGLSAKSPEGVVKQSRSEVLSDCLRAAEWKERILSLSVPTGGGKTLAAMAFALKRAALEREQYRRIIVVIPYLSIIEQNAEVYARVFGEDTVLEHHSGSFAKLRAQRDYFVPEGESEYQNVGKRPETENWDAPFIVTTSVRFFESLFSNHPSDLRRIHNIARSIVVLDEVQVLPRNLLAPLLGMMEELTRDWGCTFVLSTATKPAFEQVEGSGKKDERWKPGTLREIVQSPSTLHKKLRRVNIDWRIETAIDWPQVADWICGEQTRQALCVVNVRKHAAALYDELFSRGLDPATLFHLSTRMCPAHRLEVIGEIKKRLAEARPCLVISTQLIEAGVDVDFPVAFRALGPLDSIVQVAGRSDREGALTAKLGEPGGRLIVFLPVDHRLPPDAYEMATGVTATLAKQKQIQPDDLEAMARYFEDYYANADLGKGLLALRRDGKFRTLAENFEMISSRTQDVIVPYGEGRSLIDRLYTQHHLDIDLRRKLQRYTVGLQPWEFHAAQNILFTEFQPESNVWIASDAAYDSTKGLVISGNGGLLIG
jgi:CRISPR-associated endonuclease/helicase Cas3